MLISRISGLQINSPMPVITVLNVTIEMIAVEMAVFISLISLAPNNWETTTEQPVLEPVAKARKMMVMGVDNPTAASAFIPMYLPATTLSTMLYSC